MIIQHLTLKINDLINSTCVLHEIKKNITFNYIFECLRCFFSIIAGDNFFRRIFYINEKTCIRIII